MHKNLVALFWVLVSGAVAFAQNDDWQSQVERSLSQMGHRNWIVIADSAYPWQTSPGIETISISEDSLKVTQSVLKTLRQSKHVRPIIFTDTELAFVAENRAPGISDYRRRLASVIGDQGHGILHEKVIAKLDEAGRTFHVLLLKTKLALPYTSVFIQLDCAYWNEEAEAELRTTMAQGGSRR